MADRDSWQGLRRYSIVALVVILLLWIIYTVAGGPSTPGPQAHEDSTAAPVVRP
jgi:hypothetical protein